MKKLFGILPTALLTCLAVSVLAACGGGGSGSGGGGSSSSSASVDYQPYAVAAKVTSVVNLTANTVTLNWTDSFPAGTAYAVKAQNTDGSYTTIETVAGLGGANAAMTWKRAATVTTTYRIDAQISGQTVTLLTAHGQSTVVAEVPVTPPAILSDKAEPVTGVAKLSLNAASAYTSVDWYADQKLIAAGANSVGNPVNWNTGGLTSGTHAITARIQTATDSYLEVERLINVASTGLAASFYPNSISGSDAIDVSASSSVGIASVSVTFNGTSLGTLTASNACVRNFCAKVYRFQPPSTAASGDYAVVATITDNSGASIQINETFTISHPPVITQTTGPKDGNFVYGSFNLSGTVTTDKPATVTFKVTLGSTEILQTTAASFNQTIDVSALSPGDYTLTLSANDGTQSTVSSSTITVASSSALAYQPLLTLGASSALLAAEGDRILYSQADGTYRLRNTSTNQEVILANAASISYANDWQIDGGLVYTYGQGADCANHYCVYQWSASGAITNLSVGDPYRGNTDIHPVARQGYVLWVNDTVNMTLYNVATQAYTKITTPASLINNGYDFCVKSGVVSAYYRSANTIYEWASDTNSSIAFAPVPSASYDTQTDCDRVVVQTNESLTSSFLITLKSYKNGTSETNSTIGAGFILKDGLLSWRELNGTAWSLKVSTAFNAAPITISQLNSVLQFGSTGGTLVYGATSKVYTWKASTGQSAAMIDSSPTKTIVTNGKLYFVKGSSNILYKATVN